MENKLLHFQYIKLKINFYSNDAVKEDFFREIELFNKSNKGIIEVEIIDPLSNKNPQVVIEKEDVMDEAKDMELTDEEMTNVREEMSEIMRWLNDKLWDYVAEHYWDAIYDAINDVLKR
ncbi:MAG: hypothetical protein KKC53_04040 [Actinobacteria bacterium]|nr:hypothetical protein [Actinomycetota bacterium]